MYNIVKIGRSKSNTKISSKTQRSIQLTYASLTPIPLCSAQFNLTKYNQFNTQQKFHRKKKYVLNSQRLFRSPSRQTPTKTFNTSNPLFTDLYNKSMNQIKHASSKNIQKSKINNHRTLRKAQRAPSSPKRMEQQQKMNIHELLKFKSLEKAKGLASTIDHDTINSDQINYDRKKQSIIRQLNSDTDRIINKIQLNLERQLSNLDLQYPYKQKVKKGLGEQSIGQDLLKKKLKKRTKGGGSEQFRVDLMMNSKSFKKQIDQKIIEYATQSQKFQRLNQKQKQKQRQLQQQRALEKYRQDQIQRQIELQNQIYEERQRLLLEKQRQEQEERERFFKKQRQRELQKQKLLKKQRQQEQQRLRERQREKQRQRQRQRQIQRQKQKQRQILREKEIQRLKQKDLRQKQERQRLLQIQKDKQIKLKNQKQIQRLNQEKIQKQKQTQKTQLPNKKKGMIIDNITQNQKLNDLQNQNKDFFQTTLQTNKTQTFQDKPNSRKNQSVKPQKQKQLKPQLPMPPSLNNQKKDTKNKKQACDVIFQNNASQSISQISLQQIQLGNQQKQSLQNAKDMFSKQNIILSKNSNRSNNFKIQLKQVKKQQISKSKPEKSFSDQLEYLNSVGQIVGHGMKKLKQIPINWILPCLPIYQCFYQRRFDILQKIINSNSKIPQKNELIEQTTQQNKIIQQSFYKMLKSASKKPLSPQKLKQIQNLKITNEICFDDILDEIDSYINLINDFDGKQQSQIKIKEHLIYIFNAAIKLGNLEFQGSQQNYEPLLNTEPQDIQEQLEIGMKIVFGFNNQE